MAIRCHVNRAAGVGSFNGTVRDRRRLQLRRRRKGSADKSTVPILSSVNQQRAEGGQPILDVTRHRLLR
jgi:hypothetical protein